ncbi:hypothetical protein BGZ61DRAFT_523347 [Ilyonectria robusta]|uniref:uncharacterized protein n=1 Tax=Ilyonectria robusta TaxID=1079257 RepID=UPI001E8EBD84|nr:uncharacterized protein BGZ61DRAFT_523347 [Ilyonectria robusta]KAH8661008.1 hypothetical protein BGZ61DRAFT_523347 [Ilyonectria robusta]
MRLRLGRWLWSRLWTLTMANSRGEMEAMWHLSYAAVNANEKWPVEASRIAAFARAKSTGRNMRHDDWQFGCPSEEQRNLILESGGSRIATFRLDKGPGHYKRQGGGIEIHKPGLTQAQMYEIVVSAVVELSRRKLIALTAIVSSAAA